MTFEFRQAALSYPEPVVIPSRLIKLRFLSASMAYTRHNRGLAKKVFKHHPGKFARLRRHPDNNANDVLPKDGFNYRRLVEAFKRVFGATLAQL